MPIKINQKSKCPKCNMDRMWAFEQITTTRDRIVSNRHGCLGVDEIEKLEVLERKTKYRRICKNCGYKGTWRKQTMASDIRPDRYEVQP